MFPKDPGVATGKRIKESPTNNRSQQRREQCPRH